MLKGSVNEELCLIRQLLVLTGARLNEIAGLEWADITLPSASNVVGYLDIKSNAIRRLKTASSVRKVPLLPEATNSFSAIRMALGNFAAAMSRFSRDTGALAVEMPPQRLL